MLAFLNFLAVLWGFSAQGPVQPVQGEAHEILAQLSDLRLDKNQIHSIRDITLRRDVISLSFERGAMAFLEPVQGRVTGAIFVGSGDVLVIPPDDAERRQLNKFTGSPILNEKFSAALLRFTDDTFEEILRVLEDRAVDDVRSDELEALLPWDQNLGEVSLLQNFRILTDFLGTDEVPLFSGLLKSIIRCRSFSNLSMCCCCAKAAAAARAATFSGRLYAIISRRSFSAAFSVASRIASARCSASTRAGSHSSQVKKR